MISDLVLRWLNNEAKELNDYRQIVMRCRALTPFFQQRRLSDIVDVAQQFIRFKRNQGRKPATINRHLAALRRVATLAFTNWNIVDQNWGSKVKLLAERNQRTVFLTQTQVGELARAADSEPVRDAILLAAMSGLRRGELMRLTPASLSGDTLLIPDTKTGVPRIVPLPPQAVVLAQSCLPWRITTGQLRYGFERARAAAKMDHVHFHDLRHTYASWLLSAGVALSIVRDLLGHSSIQTTDRYVHAGLTDSRRAVASLGHSWVSTAPMLVDATPKKGLESGGPPGSRTPHQRIMSPILKDR